MNRIFIAVMLILVFAGCASFPQYPTYEEFKEMSCGPYPDKYEKIVKDYLHKILFDPYSIQDLKITKPEKQAVLRYNKYECGYVSSVSFNAKNRMGGYVGVKQYYVVIEYNNIIIFERE